MIEPRSSCPAPRNESLRARNTETMERPSQRRRGAADYWNRASHTANRSPGGCHKKYRGAANRMRRRETPAAHASRNSTLPCLGVIRNVCSRNPSMLRIPNNHRQRAEEIDCERDIRTGTAQMRARRFPQRKRTWPSKAIAATRCIC